MDTYNSLMQVSSYNPLCSEINCSLPSIFEARVLIMSGVYDNWERLVDAVLKREELRQIALCPSFSTSTASDRSFDSQFSARSNLTDPPYHGVRSMAFKEIEKATENFRVDLYLGEEPSAMVYKGWIHEDTLTAASSRSGTAVAVKKWKPDNRWLGSWPGIWLTELQYLSRLDHPNVVKLIGYCSEGVNLILVYELLHKGSLKSRLLTREHRPLSWDRRIKVAIGTARGLCFLHGRELPVIHRDIRVDNILLDAGLNAKLSGFGLATDGPGRDASHMSTHILGTYGFSAPGYVGDLMAKRDVFDFGLVLLQILSGSDYFDLTWVKPYMNDGIELSNIMDTKLKGRYPRNGAFSVLNLAFQCLNPHPKLRPRMVEVLVALQQL